MLKKMYGKMFKYFDRKNLKQNLKEKYKIPDNLVGELDILYGEDAENNTFDIYYPKSLQDKELPTIINIHGGGYVAGIKENCSVLCRKMAEKGYCVINMEYTKSETKGFPTPVYETFKLFDYINSHEEIKKHINLNKLFLSGDSAGGHISSLVANILESEDLKQKFGVKSNLKIKGLILISPVFGVFKFGKLRFLRKKLEQVVFKENYQTSIQNACNNLELLNKNFPPCIIFSALTDVLNVHTQILLKKAKKIGLCVKNYNFVSGKHLGHDFIALYPEGREGKFSLQKIDEFVQDVLNDAISFVPEKFNINLSLKSSKQFLNDDRVVEK